MFAAPKAIHDFTFVAFKHTDDEELEDQRAEMRVLACVQLCSVGARLATGQYSKALMSLLACCLGHRGCRGLGRLELYGTVLAQQALVTIDGDHLLALLDASKTSPIEILYQVIRFHDVDGIVDYTQLAKVVEVAVSLLVHVRVSDLAWNMTNDDVWHLLWNGVWALKNPWQAGAEVAPLVFNLGMWMVGGEEQPSDNEDLDDEAFSDNDPMPFLTRGVTQKALQCSSCQQMVESREHLIEQHGSGRKVCGECWMSAPEGLLG